MPSPLNRSITLSLEESLAPVPLLDHSDASLKNGIYQADIISALDILREHSFELIIADPPYNFGRDFGNNSDKQPKEEYERWMAQWISELPRIATPNATIYICGSWQNSSLIQSSLELAGLTILNRITWKRDKGRGARANWKQNMEDIWFAVQDPKNYTFNLDEVKVKKKVIAPYRENGIAKDWMEDEQGEKFRMTHPSNIWTDMTVPFWSMPENTPHPTQKPEALMERLIRASSNANDCVLDLFSGSGTTSVVAKRLGRKFVGVELNPEFIRYGLKRLSQITE